MSVGPLADVFLKLAGRGFRKIGKGCEDNWWETRRWIGWSGGELNTKRGALRRADECEESWEEHGAGSVVAFREF